MTQKNNFCKIETTVTRDHSVQLPFQPSPLPVEAQAMSLGLEPSSVETQPRPDTKVAKDGMLITFIFVELLYCIYRITRNFRGRKLSRLQGKLLLKHSRLLMMDLRIMPVMEIIRHKTFAVIRKTANPRKFPATKVSWYTVCMTILY